MQNALIVTNLPWTPSTSCVNESATLDQLSDTLNGREGLRTRQDFYFFFSCLGAE